MRSIGFGAPFRLAILCSLMFVLWAWTISALTIKFPFDCLHDISTDDRNVRAGSLQWIPSLRQSIHNVIRRVSLSVIHEIPSARFPATATVPRPVTERRQI